MGYLFYPQASGHRRPGSQCVPPHHFFLQLLQWSPIEGWSTEIVLHMVKSYQVIKSTGENETIKPVTTHIILSMLEYTLILS